ncbi:unnamed protein product [Bursaphelenchus xylophilus]|uniref:(pine wood nematode) hypothetical protein n=1 Tax=Bursaphelenchus xylophilus TaxID=6326 RepID=A0A1I7SWK2_BURXY|nr:unnamed protein product [Bursaphelenchus xylophilus]CAG9099547.1 unnamed protein product [Bursaphelenchus xylophilus]
MIGARFLLLFGCVNSLILTSLDNPTGCEWRHNVSESEGMSLTQMETLENCLYYKLAQSQPSHMEFIQDPPWEYPLTIGVDHYVVHQVDLLKKDSSQFNIHGDLYITWNDSRLSWNETDWKIDEFALHDNHHIWTPHFNEDSECSQADGCIARISDIEIKYDGTVTARFTFRFPAFCGINYYKYPEETNDCCLLLTLQEIERKVKFELKTKERAAIQKPVALTTVETEGNTKIFKNVETSIWTVTDRVIDVAKIGGYRNEFLRLCIHAKKEMSTLKIALRIPVTIATMLMLVSPLFGDLRTQSFVKLLTLTLQTICFLFLCSIAPENGFGGTKPKIYTFYEFLFFVSFLSILVTLVCLALCRVRRTVPPSHFFYLSAKLINRFFCCIEPEQSTSYQRHLEDTFDRPDSDRTTTIVDYTHEWRHIYIAVNNLFSGLSFSVFCFVIIFEIM